MLKIIRTVKGMTDYIKNLKRGKKIRVGFIPTMGYLHGGHLSLIRRADRENDVVVISIFVNPVQFGPKEDYNEYPRDLMKDKRLAESGGCDVIFNPSAEEMYPTGFDTYVEAERLSGLLCGKSRPWHFRGVTTVITKLFNIINPDTAYFGQKDYQQAVIIKHIVKDLNLNINIKILPVVREIDGLAMSSRNIYLSPPERKDAIIIHNTLIYAKKLICSGERDPKKVVNVLNSLIKQKKTAEIDYISIVAPDTLTEKSKISGEVVVTAAVWIGKTRLIDNIICYAPY